MAKKKKVVVEEIEPVEFVPQILPDELGPMEFAPADPIVLVVANGSFHDGAFKNDFEKLGYKVHWKSQEERAIPAKLYGKLMRRSGGKFTLKGEKK